MGAHRQGRERERYLDKVRAGLCPRCGQRPPGPDHQTCDECRAYQRAKHAAKTQVDRRYTGSVVAYPQGVVCSIAQARWMRDPVAWARARVALLTRSLEVLTRQLDEQETELRDLRARVSA